MNYYLLAYNVSVFMKVLNCNLKFMYAFIALVSLLKIKNSSLVHIGNQTRPIFMTKLKILRVIYK